MHCSLYQLTFSSPGGGKRCYASEKRWPCLYGQHVLDVHPDAGMNQKHQGAGEGRASGGPCSPEDSCSNQQHHGGTLLGCLPWGPAPKRALLSAPSTLPCLGGQEDVPAGGREALPKGTQTLPDFFNITAGSRSQAYLCPVELPLVWYQREAGC